MGKLLIMFVVGAILSAIGYGIIFYTDLSHNVRNLPVILIPTIIGTVLLMLSGYFGIRKFGRYMDRD